MQKLIFVGNRHKLSECPWVNCLTNFLTGTYGLHILTISWQPWVEGPCPGHGVARAPAPATPQPSRASLRIHLRGLTSLLRNFCCRFCIGWGAVLTQRIPCLNDNGRRAYKAIISTYSMNNRVNTIMDDKLIRPQYQNNHVIDCSNCNG